MDTLRLRLQQKSGWARVYLLYANGRSGEERVVARRLREILKKFS